MSNSTNQLVLLAAMVDNILEKANKCLLNCLHTVASIKSVGGCSSEGQLGFLECQLCTHVHVVDVFH